MNNPEHLGDGLYAYWDGFGIELRANHHENPTDRCYLEPYVYKNLLEWVESLKEPQEPKEPESETRFEDPSENHLRYTHAE